MKRQIYITNQEIEKCRKVVQAFNNLFKRTDICVLDTGKYGFALLKLFNYDGFYSIKTYINSANLFDALWQEWLKEELITLCINTPLIDLDYEKMFNGLSIEQQNQILKSKENLIFKANNSNIKPKITTSKWNMTNKEKNRCKIIAEIFKKDMEKNGIVIKEAEKFGFIMLEYYKPISNFDCAIVFTDSKTMFNTLLDEWFVCQIVKLMKEKHVLNIDIDKFYNKLSKEEKDNLIDKKNKFIEQAMKKAPFIKCQAHL